MWPRQGHPARQAPTSAARRRSRDGEVGSSANRFVTLVVDGAVPEYGAAVTKDGEAAGTLTSPCESPTLGKVIGMAVLRSDLATNGEQVEVAVGDGTAPATVAPLPIYDTEKKRPAPRTLQEGHRAGRAGPDEEVPA